MRTFSETLFEQLCSSPRNSMREDCNGGGADTGFPMGLRASSRHM